MVVRVLDSGDVRRQVSVADANAAMREASAAADWGGAAMPAQHGAGRDVPLGGW